MAAEGLPIQVCRRVLEVSESGFYAWRARPPSARAIRHAWLTDTIRQVHAASRQTYGSRRVHAELTLGRGITVGYHAVELLMRRAGPQGVTGRPKYRRGLRPEATATTSCGSPTSPNTPPAKASCTARWSWMPARVGWSAGPSTPPRPRR